MTRKTDHRGRRVEQTEHWTKMLRGTMETPAWRALGAVAQAIYPWIKLEWRGERANNNGKLRASVRALAEKTGFGKNAVARGLQDLQAKGFAVVTEPACLGVSGSAKSPAYELTELALPGQREGRKLFRQWAPGRDYPVARTNANNPAGANGKCRTLSPK